MNSILLEGWIFHPLFWLLLSAYGIVHLLLLFLNRRRQQRLKRNWEAYRKRVLYAQIQQSLVRMNSSQKALPKPKETERKTLNRFLREYIERHPEKFRR
jgi:hypothetical protein